MSNIDKFSKEALREVAEDAQKAHKWEGLENGLKADGYVSTTVRFIQRASPQTVLALLDELESAEKRIADLSHHLQSAHAFIEHTEAFGHAASNGILCCGDAQWNIDASKSVLAAAGKGE
ncbi:ead/Ea22-like family protein [Enterobacter asburiae]|uniref:ead/Ea22-like family protein n=1 Tax=Enterobacter asburiae TaxID=61645 RepID=UPI00192C8A1B|nr:ead/Ea22-like family protein [Enterobacter asburiae]MBL5913963.1 ead/Ea22-like family protein [Enterobacter asburiae]MBL5918417.1 ead/Ea22-like family protein [Enterobacter asburiae]